MSEPLNFYFVGYIEEDRNYDVFVWATTHQEAFELFRIDQDINPEDYRETDHTANVWLLPREPVEAGKPSVVVWPHHASETFKLGFTNLTSLAIRNAHDIVNHPTDRATTE